MKKIESILKNLILSILLFFYSPPKKENKCKIDSSSNVLLIRLNRIGDALVSTPFIKYLKKTTGCRIIILADIKNHFIFENNPNVDKVYKFKKGFKGFFTSRQIANSENVNYLFDLHDDVSTTVSFLIALSGIPNRYGLEKKNHRVFTKTIKKINPEKNHVIDRLLELSKLISGNYNNKDLNVEFFPNEQAIKKVDDFVCVNFSENDFIVGINISAGSEARFWGVDRFKSVINDLINFDCKILLIASPRDKKLAEEISNDKIKLFCSPDFDEFASVVGKLNFLFTPDSSIIHLASAFKIPVFGLYVKYQTKDIIWFPYQSKYETVVTEEPNFENLEYNIFKDKFLSFFNKVYDERNSKL